MVARIEREVRVQPGGRIEIAETDLPAGAIVHVTVDVELSAAQRPRDRPFESYFGKVPRSFGSSAEADAFLQALRDEWD